MTDRLRFWLPPALFLLFLAALGFVGCAARADELDDKIAALKARRAANKADPFAGKNAASPYKECGCGSPDACACPGGPGGGVCQCYGCLVGPRLGDRKVTDDPARPWTWAYGDEYGYGHVLGWYRPAVACQPALAGAYSFDAGGGCASWGPGSGRGRGRR